MYHIYYIYTVTKGQKSLEREVNTKLNAAGLEIERIVRTADKRTVVKVLTQRDPSGKISQVITSGGDGRQHSRIHFLYNSQNLLIEKKFYDRNDRLTAFNQWFYNEHGSLKRFLKSKTGQYPFLQTIYSYDSLGRETEISELGKGDKLLRRKIKRYSKDNQLTEEIVYDAEGQIIARIVPEYNPDGQETFILWYDKENRLQRKEIFTYKGKVLAGKTEIDFFKQSKTIQEYDEAGHQLSNRWYNLPDHLVRKVQKIWHKNGQLIKQLEFVYSREGDENPVREIQHYYK